MATESLEYGTPGSRKNKGLPVVAPGPGVEFSQEQAARAQYEELKRQGFSREGEKGEQNFFFYGDKAHCTVAPNEASARVRLISMAVARGARGEIQTIREMRLVAIPIDPKDERRLIADTRPVETDTYKRLLATLQGSQVPPAKPE